GAFGEGSYDVQGTVAFELFARHVLENRVISVVLDEADRRDQFIAVVVGIVAAEYLRIELRPGSQPRWRWHISERERVRGRADADDRLARLDVQPHIVKLL